MTNRIASLPRRDWRSDAPMLAESLSSALRTNVGTMTLRPVQAAALWDIMNAGGLFGHIRVGAGKTLISALAPTVLGSQRPMLLVPAQLVQKTLASFEVLRLHWQISHAIRVVSYSRLGLAEHANLIDAYQPDLLVCDEAHKLKRIRESAVARRVSRYMTRNPACRFVALSGTLTNSSIADYAHLLIWALRDRAPIPNDPDVLDEWCALLDSRSDADRWDTLEPALGGPLRSLEAARVAFRARLTSSPGVIISRESWHEQPLTIRLIPLRPPESMDQIFARLRDEWIAPDDWPLADQAREVWRVARQLGVGFCYVHEPRPPLDWFEARRAWCRFVRSIIRESNVFDTDFQVASACAEGRLPDAEWLAWKEIEPTHTPNTVPMWFSAHAIDFARDWGAPRSIVWTEHTAFAERLQSLTGWPYYGDEGTRADGKHIMYARGSEGPIIVSIHSCREGVDMQPNPMNGNDGFNRNLFVTPPPNGTWLEQAIGRTHRDGQTDPVIVDMLMTVDESEASLSKATTDAEYTQASTGLEQKILIAGWE